MGVRITLAGGVYFGSQPQREHLTGVSWRVTKKKRLLVFDADGKEIARYKDHRWSDVWLTDGISEPKEPSLVAKGGSVVLPVEN